MAERIPPASREVVPGPPPGFRPSIPGRVKAAVRLRQGGKCARTGEWLDGRDVDYDHRPPLQARRWDAAAVRPRSKVRGDTIPPANDPDFIDAILREVHRGVRSITSRDVAEIAKTKRLAKQGAEDQAAMAAKECGKRRPRRGTIRSRGFQRRKGP